MSQSDLKYWIALSCNPKIGARTFLKIKNRFSDFEQVWNSQPSDFEKRGLPAQIYNLVIETRSKFDPELEFKKISKFGVSAVTLKDKQYPKLLAQISDPPAVLYYKGAIESLGQFPISIVGSRKYTQYGQRVTWDLVSNLAKSGLTIVSGLALGIDSIAHQTTLEFKGQTAAVLGCGLDQIYPPSNRALADKIIQKDGAILSEFPLGTPAYKSNFPVRNRILAGLSLGTVVVEAAEGSGALITAWHALEYNRQVFAVPGSIYSENSFGPNNLIKMGAKAVTSSLDILDELNLKDQKIPSKIEGRKLLTDSKEEEIVLKYLTKEPVHIDKISKGSGLDISKINSTLTLLEIKGYVRNLGGGNFVLN